MSRITNKGLVVPLIFLCSLIQTLTLTPPSSNALLANMDMWGVPSHSQFSALPLFLVPLNLTLKREFWNKLWCIFTLLTQRDSSLARILFASLFKSVFAEVDHVLTDREAESTKRAVRDGLNAVMEASTQFYPPFIGSLQVSLKLSCVVQ